MNNKSAITWARVLGKERNEDDVTIAVRAIVYDLSDRRGFRSVIDDCDEEDIKDIQDSWASIIREVVQ